MAQGKRCNYQTMVGRCALPSLHVGGHSYDRPTTLPTRDDAPMNASKDVLTVLEAAGREPWTASAFTPDDGSARRRHAYLYAREPWRLPDEDQGGIVVAEVTSSEHHGAAIVLAVNTFTAAREALRLVAETPCDHPAMPECPREKARAALAAMEGKS